MYRWIAFLLMPIVTGQQFSAICFGTLDFDLPVRYLHVQIVSQGRNLTESIGDLRLEVEASEKCRLRKELIDRFDGMYIVRIRLLNACPYLKINLETSDGSPLCGSPLRVEKGEGRLLMADHCDCGQEKMEVDEWLKKHRCPNEEPQLKEDLKRFPLIEFAPFRQVMLSTWASEEYRYSASVCHYRIRSNKVHRKCYGEYTGFKGFFDEMITSLARKIRLPDTEFFFNLGDYPLGTDREQPLPVVSWCGSVSSSDIVVPTYEITQSVLAAMDRIHLDIHTARGPRSDHVPWKDKLSTAVFRGRDSNQLRLDLARLSLERPDLLDVAITRYFFFNESQHTPTKKSVLFHEFFKHKYVLSIDGTVAAYRLPLLLSGDSVILKGPSEYYEHFYAHLKPHEHFVPFDLPNIARTLAIEQEANHAKILPKTRQFVLDHLQPLNIFCYYVLFLKEYSKRVQVAEDLHEGEDYGSWEEAPRPPATPCPCSLEEFETPPVRHQEL